MGQTPLAAQEPIDQDNFSIADLDDEIRVDQLCQKLLKKFHRYLLDRSDITPLEAGSLAGGADYFLRDYVLDSLRRNIFTIGARQVRGFAGSWYIHRTLEPNIKELEAILNGVAAFYRYGALNDWLDSSVAEQIATVCADLDFFRGRIDSFHALQGDDYPNWCEQCPVG